MGKLEQRALIARHPAAGAGSRARGEPKTNHGACTREGKGYFTAYARERGQADNTT